jgi:hypothetical protein
MYRIEVATGEETVFRTVEELATGIRNGLITPRSRIWHGASQKWLPVEIHPHYKKALDLVTGGAPMIDTGLVKPPSRRAPAPSPSPSSAPEPRAEARHATPSPAPTLAPPSPRAPAPAPPRIAGRATATALVEPRSYLPPAPIPPAVEPPAQRVAPTVDVTLGEVPEIELPRITYPDVPVPAPAEAHPVARRRAAPRTPLLLVGAVIATLASAYLVRESDAAVAAAPAAPAASGDDAGVNQESDFGDESPFADPPTPAPEPPKPEVRKPVVPKPASAAARLPAPLPASRPTGPVSQAWSSSAGAIAQVTSATPSPARPAPAADAPVIAPAPATLDFALPSLPSADTIGAAADAMRDSAAMKRILRAVSGRPVPGKPAQR